MSKYTIDITFFEMDGSITTNVLEDLSYERLLEVYAFSNVLSMPLKGIWIHTSDFNQSKICIEEFLVTKLSEKLCNDSASMYSN